MSVVAVLPVKRFADAKQRLAEGGLRPSDRVALATGMLTDVLDALRRCAAIDDVVVVTSDPNAEVLARSFGAQVVHDTPADDHSGAAQLGISWAAQDGAFHALVLPGDAPAIDPAEIDALLEHLSDGPEVVILPDRHGTGTNGLLLTPPEVMVPQFGEGSRERHERVAREAGATVRVVEIGSLQLDVDTREDLDALEQFLAGRPAKTALYTRDAMSRVRPR